MARDLGKQGFAICEAADRMGVHRETMLGWEKRIPEFRKAFRRIRQNSERWKAWRQERLLAKTEEQLLVALARVRAKKAAELEKLKAKFGNSVCE